MIKLASVAAVAVALAQTVQASQITGIIQFSGSATTDGTGSTATATKVTSWISPTISANGTGSFAPTILNGASVSVFSPWVFNTSSTINSFWTVGAFTFQLTSSTISSVSPGDLSVALVGTVTSTIAGLDPTAFTGYFNLTPPTAGTGNVWTFSDSFSFGPSGVVPDGGTTVMLLGAALSGLALIKRKLVA